MAVLLFIVAIWIAGAVWGMRRAVRAGYSEVVAGVGAFLLGPFAPLMALVKPAGKQCQFCKSVMQEDATVCPRCAREQAPPVVKASPEEIKAGLAAAHAAAQEAAKSAQAAERQRVRERIAAENAEKQRLAQERLDAMTQRKSG